MCPLQANNATRNGNDAGMAAMFPATSGLAPVAPLPVLWPGFLCVEIIGFQPERGLKFHNGVVKATSLKKERTKIVVGLRIAAINFQGFLELDDRFVRVLRARQGDTKIVVNVAIGRLDFDSLLKLCNCLVNLSALHQGVSQIIADAGIVRIDLQRRLVMKKSLVQMSLG
jgi:hypothetical protein